MRETSTAQINLGDDGVLTVHIREGVKQSLADARQNLSAALDERGGLRRPILVDIRRAQPLDADVRHFYTGQVLIDGFCAIALLVEASPLGRMMGNVYLRVARPGIPTQLFTSESGALAWLRDHQL